MWSGLKHCQFRFLLSLLCETIKSCPPGYHSIWIERAGKACFSRSTAPACSRMVARKLFQTPDTLSTRTSLFFLWQTTGKGPLDPMVSQNCSEVVTTAKKLKPHRGPSGSDLIPEHSCPSSAQKMIAVRLFQIQRQECTMLKESSFPSRIDWYTVGTPFLIRLNEPQMLIQDCGEDGVQTQKFEKTP